MPRLRSSWMFLTLTGFLFLALSLTFAAGAAPKAVRAQPYPEVIPLPTGFQPEGITVAPGGTFFVGSIPTGAVYRGDLQTGEGTQVVPPQSGRRAIGLDVDQRDRLFVAGGPTGEGYVYDAYTGQELATYQLATNGMTFVNDVVVTRTGAWFTDSFNPVLYHVPIAPDGTLGSQADVQTLPLSGDIQYMTGFNANGIDALPNGKTLVIVQSNTGTLFTVDPTTGETSQIDLGGETVTNGDGILLHGRTLYVVQNQLNQVAVIALAPDLSSGKLVETLTDPDLDVPTTIARFGNRLYAVNARFGIADPGNADYAIVQLRRAGSGK